MSTLKEWIWLASRPGLPAGVPAHLLEHFGTPEAVYRAGLEEYEQAGISKNQRAVLSQKDLSGTERILEACARLDLSIITIQDAAYPERLRQIPDPPCVLYVRGRLFPLGEALAIGVVGTRTPTPYGLEMAGTLGLDLARSGAVVVSGIAQGLDCAALRGALRGGGRVVSVLGNGIDVIYPSGHRWLYEDVAAAGALVSEFPPGAPPKGWHFPVRNRIISGLSMGVAVIEAARRSGALITARLALEQNRDVFAFPGPVNAPMSEGTNRLIQRGEAKLICSAQDVLAEYEQIYAGELRRPAPLTEKTRRARLEKEPQRQDSAEKAVDNPPERAYITLKDYTEEFTEDERDILLALGEQTLHPDELAEATGISAQRVLSALTTLQIRGCVEERPGRRFEAAAPGV